MKFSVSIILLFPFLVLAQSIKIEHISENVNGCGSELNFVQIDENTAYYTSATLEEEQYQSAIFSSQFKHGIQPPIFIFQKMSRFSIFLSVIMRGIVKLLSGIIKSK